KLDAVFLRPDRILLRRLHNFQIFDPDFESAGMSGGTFVSAYCACKNQRRFLWQCPRRLEHFSRQIFLEGDALGNTTAIPYQEKLKFPFVRAVIQPASNRDFLALILG